MIKRIIFTILIIISLNNCGYVPTFKNFNDTNFSIKILNLIGDREVNNLLALSLNNYINVQKEKVFEIQISTIYTKVSIAKDTSGKTTDYQMRVNSIFDINNNGITNTINLIETFEYKSIDDQFEQEEYEKTIKENIVYVMSQKLISQLSRMK